MSALGSFSSDRCAPDARGLSASLRKRTCANSPRYVCLVPMVKRALLVALAGDSRSISPPEPGDCEKDEPNGPHNGLRPDRGVVPMFCRKPRLGKDPVAFEAAASVGKIFATY